VRPFGMFVKLRGYYKHGLVHLSQVHEALEALDRDMPDEQKMDRLRVVAAEGEEVWVKVISVREEQGKLGCSMKVVDQATGADLDPDNVVTAEEQKLQVEQRRRHEEFEQRRNATDEPPAVYSIHKCSVRSVRPFGIFVELPGYRKHGLVHLSQISNYLDLNREDSDESKVESLRQVVAEGDQVYAKVLSTHDENTGELKIACSMKVVRQSDGHDLDPTNLQIQKEHNRGAGGPRGGPVSGSIDDPLWMMKQRGNKSDGYELLEDSDDDVPRKTGHGNGPGIGARGDRPVPAGPAGRGRGMVVPAWMTRGDGAEGGGIGEPPKAALKAEETPKLADLPQKVTTKEEALLVLESLLGKKEDKHRKKHRDKEKKHKREKKHKKEKKRSH